MAGRYVFPLLMPAILAGAAALAVVEARDAEGAPKTDVAPSPTDPALPGPAPRGHAAGDPSLTNAACSACHQEIAAEWTGSMHQTAYVDPVFQEALALEPFGFCRGCHAPEADPARAPSATVASEGVGCVTCHVEGHDIVGAKPNALRADAHRTVGDARMQSVAACAACHQFDFPASKGAPMQNTLAEHASSKLAAVSCQGCHMPTIDDGSGKRHTSHRFSVIGDPAMIRSAALVDAERANAREVRVTIEAGNVGHAFPTGDMFRRLEVRAGAFDEHGNLVRTAPSVQLARTFADRPAATDEASFARVQIGDTRVPAKGAGDGRHVLLRFDRPVDGLTVRWSVVYQRMGNAMAASFGVAQAKDETVVAAGVLPRAGDSPNHEKVAKASQ